jgi:hypothetical protein
VCFNRRPLLLFHQFLPPSFFLTNAIRGLHPPACSSDNI